MLILLLVCKPLKGTCMSRTSLKASGVSSELPEIIQPMGVLMVKGWTRGLALQIILMAAFEDDSFLQGRMFAIMLYIFQFLSYLGQQHNVVTSALEAIPTAVRQCVPQKLFENIPVGGQ